MLAVQLDWAPGAHPERSIHSWPRRSSFAVRCSELVFEGASAHANKNFHTCHGSQEKKSVVGVGLLRPINKETSGPHVCL